MLEDLNADFVTLPGQAHVVPVRYEVALAERRIVHAIDPVFSQS
jgi:hypothetical protein